MLVVKNLPASAGDAWDKDSIPGSGRSLCGEHGNPRTIKTPQSEKHRENRHSNNKVDICGTIIKCVNFDLT